MSNAHIQLTICTKLQCEERDNNKQGVDNHKMTHLSRISQNLVGHAQASLVITANGKNKKDQRDDHNKNINIKAERKLIQTCYSNEKKKKNKRNIKCKLVDAIIKTSVQQNNSSCSRAAHGCFSYFNKQTGIFIWFNSDRFLGSL